MLRICEKAAESERLQKATTRLTEARGDKIMTPMTYSCSRSQHRVGSIGPHVAERKERLVEFEVIKEKRSQSHARFEKNSLQLNIGEIFQAWYIVIVKIDNIFDAFKGWGLHVVLGACENPEF